MFNLQFSFTSEEEKRVTILFGISLLVLLAMIFFLVFVERMRDYRPFVQDKESPDEHDQQNSIAHIDLEAQAAYVVDAATGKVLYSKNAEAQLPLASITKVMTAIVATEHSLLNETVFIDGRALAASGDDGFELAESWTLRDLLSFTLAVSSNDGAAAVAYTMMDQVPSTKDPAEVFVERMNQKAQELGLVQTYFLNPTGLDSTEYTSGGYGSAHDVARMLQEAIRSSGEVFEGTTISEATYSSLSNKSYDAQNTNEIVDQIPGLIASKTGFTDLAGGNLVIAFDAGFNHPIIIAVLGSTLEGRFTDVKKLVDVSLQHLSLQ